MTVIQQVLFEVEGSHLMIRPLSPANAKETNDDRTAC